MVSDVRLVHCGEEVASGTRVKYLGLMVDRELKWKDQVSHVRKKCLATLSRLRRLFPALPMSTRLMLYNALVLPYLGFCSSVWHQCSETLSTRIERIQNYAMRLITSSPPRTSSDELCSNLSWMTLQDRRRFRILCKVHRCLHHQAPDYLCSKFTLNLGRTRGFGNVYLQRPQSEFYRKSFEYDGGKMWNSLPNHLKTISSPLVFKRLLHSFILQNGVPAFV